MPSSLTHYTFATFLSGSIKYKNLFYLGTQGPDPFFFYGYSFIKRKNINEVRNFGSFLHHTDIAPIYLELLKYAKKIIVGDDQEKLLCYIRGLFAHYVLDRNCHPYIFYRSGFKLDDDDETNYFYEHSLFETRIDTIISNKEKTFMSPKAAIKNDKNDVRIVSKMWSEVISKITDATYIEENTFYLCYKDMGFASSMLFSKTGAKNQAIKCVLGNSTAYSMSCSPLCPDKDEKDYLNLKKKVWRHPVTGINHFESFLELMEFAKLDYREVNKIIDNFLLGKDVKKELSEFVNDINHDGDKNGTVKKYKA